MSATAYDRAHLSAASVARLDELGAQWSAASAAGDVNLMNRLRAEGEAIRNGAGYGTSDDGSEVVWSNHASSEAPVTVGNSVLPSYQEIINQSHTIAQENNAVAQENAQAAWEFNAAEAQKSRDWSEYMSNTAHQREVQDLLKAGLNPVLSATGGSGAAVPSAASASGSAAGVDNSTTSIFGSYLNALLGSATTLAAANTNAKASETVAKINAASAYQIAHDFPSSDKVLGEVLQNGLDWYKDNNLGTVLLQLFGGKQSSSPSSANDDKYWNQIYEKYGKKVDIWALKKQGLDPREIEAFLSGTL